MADKTAMDLTAGKPIRQIFLFSLPLVVGTLFQQLYSFVDTVMVGRFISSRALAAVGATYSLNFLTLGFVLGSCVGTGSGEAGALAVQYLAIISCLFPIHGSLMILRNTLQGMGYSVHAVFSGVAELLGRALGCWLTIRYLGFVGVCISNPMAWGCGLIYCGGILPYFLKKRSNMA